MVTPNWPKNTTTKSMMAKVHKQHDSGNLFVLNIFERSIRTNISAFKLIQVCIIVTTGNC